MSDDVAKKTPTPAQELVHLLATAEITLESLTPEQRALVEQALDFDELKAELAVRVDLAGLHWPQLTRAWLDDGPWPVKTRVAYEGALAKFDAWASKGKLNPLRLTRAQADEFINSMMKDGRWSDTTVRVTAKWISSLYEWIRRRHGVPNPFRGTRAKPRPRRGEILSVPSPAELESILKTLKPQDALVVSFLSGTGVPPGSLPWVEIKGTSFATVFKGRSIKGSVPPAAAALLKKLPSESRRRPFEDRAPAQWTMRIRSLLAARAKPESRYSGAASQAWSLRDLQNFWVVQTWPGSRDLIAFRDRLGVSSVTLVEGLVKRLGLPG